MQCFLALLLMGSNQLVFAQPGCNNGECPSAETDHFSTIHVEAKGRKGRGKDTGPKVPLIFDNDANYDDILSLVYIANHPLFDLKALTICSSGMGTPSQGPTNMRSILNFLGRPEVPIARGYPNSLSPIATMPLQWRIELDTWIEAMKRKPLKSNPSKPLLEDTLGGISSYSAPKLMIKILKESQEKVVILATGPLTNLAVALDEDPSIADNIQAVFIMGSSYGEMSCESEETCGRNNVFSWQFSWNGVWQVPGSENASYGACTEDGQLDELGGNFLDVTVLGYEQNENGVLGSNPNLNPVRPGCRGQTDMSNTANTEWNVFMDAVAWQQVLGYLEDKEVDVFALAVNATLDMPVTQKGMLEQTSQYLKGKPDLEEFMVSLAKAFTNAGEAKWWDAQLAVAMSEVLTGLNNPAQGSVCAKWLTGVKPAVSTTWRSDATTNSRSSPKDVRQTTRAPRAGVATVVKADEETLPAPLLNPYGSVTDTDSANAPLSAFCVSGDVDTMVTTYWSTVAGTSYPSGTAPCEAYPECMGWSKVPGEVPGKASSGKGGGKGGKAARHFWDTIRPLGKE